MANTPERTAFGRDSVIEAKLAPIARAAKQLITAVAPNRAPAVLNWPSTQKDGNIARSRTSRGQNITARRPKRSERAPPTSANTIPVKPCETVAPNEALVLMPRVVLA